MNQYRPHRYQQSGCIGRGSAVFRCLKLLDMLANRQYVTLKQMRDELKVDPRTAFRDMAILQRMGFEIWDEFLGGESGYHKHIKIWRIKKDKRVENILRLVE